MFLSRLDASKCTHAVLLQVGIYFDILQCFPPSNAGIIPQSHHTSAQASVQFTVTLLQNVTIITWLIIITNSLLLFYPPLWNAYWQEWNGNDGLFWPPPITLAPLIVSETFESHWFLCLGLIHLPIDLPQVQCNLCSLMDAIIPSVHAREKTLGCCQSQDGLDAASVYLKILSSVCVDWR